MKMSYNNITADDYTFADNNLNEMWAIKLKTKYEGVVYCYGKVQAKLMDEDTGNANLSFQYQILDAGEYDQKELDESEDFCNYIGDVLSHVIQDAFDNDKYRIGDEFTNDGTQEST